MASTHKPVCHKRTGLRIARRRRLPPVVITGVQDFVRYQKRRHGTWPHWPFLDYAALGNWSGEETPRHKAQFSGARLVPAIPSDIRRYRAGKNGNSP